ncbi:D-tyrosyl-tRNA(Tyr) deacylase [Stomatobaculum longum]|uniref:D-aminoacyl-tRNA deacylase n=1 Tax=Stomatobaculum longum TaxID=796942 RepID=A0AA37DG80_9FIRM|nr:D-aminoacyl-tRNA deacylase [Stomatobaculum longum]EHO16751.1 D-tyrosyl-tRNA(Tyr) deacylase [Stomatobaculum longum]
MRFVLQCVSQASCTVEGRVTGAIERGYLILAGISDSDTEETADRMLKKVAGLRIFPDENGKTNLSLAEIGGSILLISQFTLYADCRKGNRPSFVKAGKPEHAERLYRYLLEHCRREGIGKTVEEGIFGADMKIALVNEGPFTLVLDSEELLRK